MARNARGKGKAKNQGGTMVLLMILMGITLIYRPALVILLSAGLIPTFVAWLTDSNPFRIYRIRIILAFNLAGCLPYIIALNQQSGGFGLAINLIADFNSYLVMYGFAAVGWVIVFVAPSVAAIVLQIVGKSRLNSIQNDKNRMMEEWGKTVAGMKDDDDDVDEEETELVDKLNESTSE